MAAAQSAAPGRLPAVAIAWGDERLWLWNPETNQARATNDARYNNTLAQVPGLGLVSGSASGLKVWSIAEQPSVRTRFEQTLGRTIPRATALVASRGDRNFDTIAVVSREAGTEQDRLYLVDPRRGQLLAQPANLWNGRGTQPALAASSAGDVAVAGGRSHRISLFRVADLRQNRPAPRQVLDSSGEVVRVATIARKGDGYGLVLSATSKQQPGEIRTRLLDTDQIFDVPAESFATDRRGWAITTPAAAGWSARHESRGAGAEQRFAIIITGGGQRAGEVLLEPRQQLGDYALLPPRVAGDRALLTVAYFDFENGQPVLAMFDAASGARFRELLGHTGRITSTSFSQDGRLLATAAEDQTVCVWTLADLDQVLGVRGQLKGLKIDARSANGGRADVVIAEADRSLSGAGLAPGDILEGIVSGGRLQSFDSPRAFYEALFLVKPGETVTLRRLRGANDRRDVEVVAGQGVDERKPLFTFFSSRAAGRQPARWIGWSPLGPFESSGDLQVEKLLGWHFNTGQADAPVSFASVDQYRARFETDGLLQKLLETGRPQLPPEREPEAPIMSLWLDQAGQEPAALEPGTSLVIRTPAQSIEATTGSFPTDEVESIEWRIGEQSGKFQPGEGGWRADLSQIAWRRGRYPVQVTLATTPPHRELKQVLTLVYQPLPPTIKTGHPARVETASEQFDFQAAVAPAAAGEAFQARLTNQHGSAAPVLLHELKSAQTWDEPVQVKLQPGMNLLKLVAENADAMSDRPENERATASIEVYYNPPKAAPGPRIELSELILRPAGETEEVRPLKSEDTVVVSSPHVVLRGLIRGADVLALAEYRLNKQDAPVSLRGFAPNKSKELKIEQELSLQSGRNRLILQAKSANGEMTERSLNLDYQPPLPTLAARPLPGRVFEEQYPIVADLNLPADRQAYQVEVYLNDEKLSEKEVQIDDERIRALASLRPGDNRLELRLSNEFGSAPVVQTIGVEYVRPPKIIDLTSEQQHDPEAVVMRLSVESERRPAAAIVQVNGEERRAEFEARQGDKPDRWLLDFKPLLIEPGKSRIQVAVKDEQAQSADKELVVNVEKRFAPPPEIVVLSAHDHPVLPDTPVAVEAVVRSSSPIRDLRVETGGGRGEVLHSAADLGNRQTKNEQGQYEYHLKTSVPGGVDSKLLRIEAVNGGGRKTADILNTVIVPPAGVFLESVALKSQPKRTFPLTKNQAGRLVLNQDLPESELILSGYVLSPRGQAAESRKIPVQVWVNGFLQRPTFAEPVKGDSARWPFQAEIVLSQRRSNQIDVDIVDPDLPSDAANRTTLALDCAKPNKTRKLHLLIVAVGAKREEGALVQERAVAAVQGRSKNAREFSTPAFEQGVIHGLLLGNTVQRNKVLFEIGRLARNLKPNDVAMIYYQGDVRDADE
ncbi:MAG TPA: WD40 repeat domain-containing protein, partial [Pirellulales bacterium]|nr:WD40 repeat domain-containing protein [Pirellulales bacterium]